MTPEQQAILDELGYVDGPSSRTLYYSAGRGSELYNGSGRFDLSLHYDIPVWRSLRPWLKIEWYNLTNNDKLISFNTTVRPDKARCSCLPARGDAGDEGVIRAVEVRMLQALAIEAQLEAQPLPAEQAQAIAQPVIAPVLGGPDAEPRRPTQPAVTPWYFVRS